MHVLWTYEVAYMDETDDGRVLGVRSVKVHWTRKEPRTVFEESRRRKERKKRTVFGDGVAAFNGAFPVSNFSVQ